MALLMLAAALVLRHGFLGDPLAGYDEQFYLLVGDRMLHGAVPYVDLWDRKPPGLFLLYAGIRLLGGDGVLAYQLVATLFAAATAFVVALIAGRRTGMIAGGACGLLYLLMLNPLRGDVGQAPVFYNLFMAAAGGLTLAALPVVATRAGLIRAAAAMLLCGVALTIKTTAIFESAWFGIALLLAMQRARVGWAGLAGRAALFMALGAAPFLACAGWYIAHGQFAAFWFANAQSAMLRHQLWSPFTGLQLFFLVANIGPLAILAAAGWRFRRDEPASERRFLLGWIASAGVGIVSVGYFYEHYALPMLVPLAIAAAPFVAQHRLRLAALAVVAAAPVWLALVSIPAQARVDRAQWPAIRAAIPAAVREQCLMVFNGPPILYHLTGACTVSRFAFPDHLASSREASALGVDQQAALTEALARRPAAIVTDDDRWEAERSPATRALLFRVLRREYRLAAVRPLRFFEETRHLSIWVRR